MMVGDDAQCQLCAEQKGLARGLILVAHPLVY